MALCCWAQTTSFVLPGALPRPQQHSDLGRPLSYSCTCQAPLDNTLWHYVTLLTRLCFVILGTGFSLPLFSLNESKQQIQRQKTRTGDGVLLADRVRALQPPEGPPQWGDSASRLLLGQAGPSWASGEAPSLFQDVKPHLLQRGLSLASCQGQTMEGYFLFRGMVVI